MNICYMTKIAIFSLAREEDDSLRQSARIIGRQIAGNNCILVTGDCSGLVQRVALEVHSKRGVVVGLSATTSKRNHLEKKYRTFPPSFFTGPERARQRELVAGRVDAAIFLSDKTDLNDEPFCLKSRLTDFVVTGILVTPDADSSLFGEVELQHRVMIVESDPVKLVQLVFKHL